MVPASLVILNPYTLKFKRSFCDFSKTVPTSELGFGSAPDPSLILMNCPHSFCHSKVGAHDTHQNNGLVYACAPKQVKQKNEDRFKLWRFSLSELIALPSSQSM